MTHEGIPVTVENREEVIQHGQKQGNRYESFSVGIRTVDFPVRRADEAVLDAADSTYLEVWDSGKSYDVEVKVDEFQDHHRALKEFAHGVDKEHSRYDVDWIARAGPYSTGGYFAGPEDIGDLLNDLENNGIPVTFYADTGDHEVPLGTYNAAEQTLGINEDLATLQEILEQQDYAEHSGHHRNSGLQLLEFDDGSVRRNSKADDIVDAFNRLEEKE